MYDIEDILTSLGITVHSRSHAQSDGHTELSAPCPHHYEGTRRDSNPSWTINADTGAHKCHGCGFGGSLEWLVQVIAKVDREEAVARTNRGERTVRRLRELDPWDGEPPRPVRPMTRARINAYPSAPNWAQEARQISQASCDAFEVRWDVEQVCWVLPILEPTSFAPIGMQLKGEGNRFFKNLPAGVEKSSTLFGIQLLHGGPVVLVESPLDAVLLHEVGMSAVASFGAEVSHAQMELLIERADRIVLALDNDDAGHKTTERLLGMKNGKITPYYPDYSRRIEIEVMNYPAGIKDPGDMSKRAIEEAFSATVSSLRFQMAS